MPSGTEILASWTVGLAESRAMAAMIMTRKS